MQEPCEKKVLDDYASGRVDYQFEFLRRKNNGSVFWGSTRLRSCLNPESGDVIMFFYTVDITEQKLQSQLLNKIADLDYDNIMDLDIPQGTYQVISLPNSKKISIPQNGNFIREARKVADSQLEKRTGRSI